MSQIRCPECGTLISEKALMCPFCGYTSKNPHSPISEQDHYHPTPTIEVIGERWNIIPISDADNELLIDYLSDFRVLEIVAPNIAKNISCIFNSSSAYVADIDAFTRSLLEEGTLEFMLDKDGNLLATLKNAETQKISNIIRLKEVTAYPELNNAFCNLSNQITMAQILDEIQNLEETMVNTRIELQEDRLAMADSAWDKMVQARSIIDRRLKSIAMQNAINSATEAKRVLMRNFSVSLETAIKSKRAKEVDTNAQNAVRDLIALTNCVHIECNGYAYIDESEAIKECLDEFLQFIHINKLDDQNTLLLLNESLPIKYKNPKLCNDFQKVVTRISMFVNQLDEAKRLEALL